MSKDLRRAAARWPEMSAVLFGTVLLPVLLSFGLTPQPSLRLLLWSLLVAASAVLTFAFAEADAAPSVRSSESERRKRRYRALLRFTLWTSAANVLPLVLLIGVALVYSVSLRLHANAPGLVKATSALLFLSLFYWTGRAVWRRMRRAARDYRSNARTSIEPPAEQLKPRIQFPLERRRNTPTPGPENGTGLAVQTTREGTQTMDFDLDWIQGFADAQALLGRLLIEVIDNEFAWHKLYRAKTFVARELVKLGETYFAEERESAEASEAA